MSPNEAAPFSRYWGIPLLLDNATPLSSWLSYSTLRPGYIFGEPKLIDAPDIWSRKLGAPVSWNKSVSQELNIPELSPDVTSKN
jgi:hypothetical protein